MIKRLASIALLLVVPVASGVPAHASCAIARLFSAPYSYIYTPGIVNGLLDSTVTADFSGSFWALGEGHPATQAGVDNGKFQAVDGNFGGWLTIRPRVNQYGYPPAIDSSWSASVVDGCIDTTGSDPEAPDLQQCMVTLFADQHSGAGFFAVSSAPADASGNYDLSTPGDQPINLTEIPHPFSDFDPYLHGPTNTVSIDPPQLDGSGQYIDFDCPDVLTGFRVYRQIVPAGSPPPVDRTRDDGDGVGWEVPHGGQLPTGQPLPLSQPATLMFFCAERSDVYLAFSLAFDSGYETPYLSRNHLQFAIDCCADADGDGTCAAPGEASDCDDTNPNCVLDCTDSDGDQHCVPDDCNDGDGTVHSDIAEVCDGVDNNCDGRSDESPVAIAAVTETGVVPGGTFGEVVAALGDVDGDGYGDFIVGASLDTVEGFTGAGSATVFSGRTRLAIQRVLHPDPQAGDHFGGALIRIGDVNADGIDDILIGAAGDDTAAGVDAGSAFIFSGSRPEAFELLHPIDDPAAAAADGLGTSVAVLDDLNGDGFRDVAVGVPGADEGRGRVRVLSGAGGYGVRTLSDAAAQPGDRFGCAVAGIGDLNGDGAGELLIASCGGDSPVAAGAGKVTVIAGRSWLPLGTMFDPLGQEGDGFGESVAGLDDIDGDGIDDALIGAPATDSPLAGLDAGNALLFSGDTGLPIHRLNHPQPATGDRFGACVAGIGDLDGDGITDVAIGAPADDTASGSDAGSVTLFSSATGHRIQTLESPAGAVGATFGSAIASVGHLDDDAVEDLFIGAPGADSASGAGTGNGVVFSGAATQDQDGDGSGDRCDCAPQDPSAQSPPPPLANVALAGATPALLTWPNPGAEFRFDVAGGLLSELRADGGLDRAVCVIDDAANIPAQDDRPPPPIGDGYYYLPRAQNACADGGYGFDSAGLERQLDGVCP